MADICVELADVNFSYCLFFGCNFLLFVGGNPSWIHSWLPFRIILHGVCNSGIDWPLVDIDGQKKAFIASVGHFIVKTIFGWIFLKN